MLIITKQLREFLAANHGLAESATDDDVRQLTADLVSRGEVTPKQLQELTDMAIEETEDRVKTLVKEAIQETQTQIQNEQSEATTTIGEPKPTNAFGDTRVRVKSASESYDDTKVVAKHAKLGREVFDELGRPATKASQLDIAKMGVWLKHTASRAGVTVSWTEHEKSLLHEVFDADTFCGKMGTDYGKGIAGHRVKALLDDSTSGGTHVVPEWFDAQIVHEPLLSGELFPLVDLKEVPRGSSIEGASIANPTAQWGVGDGAAMSLFDTSGLISAITASVRDVSVAVEVGLDFLSDAATEVGRHLEEAIARRMANELDRVIAVGNGTNEPTGLKNAAGLNTVNSVNGAGGPPAVVDFEKLLFGIGKEYRASGNVCYVSNDTLYQRKSSLQVDVSDDRRVFGMRHEDYTTFSRPHKINNSLANTECYFGDLRQYRMYRRAGASVHWELGGKELRRENKGLLIVRARYAGQVVQPKAFAKMTDLQT